jgi:RNA polymerase sigma-70 factor (ECF subfamily)
MIEFEKHRSHLHAVAYRMLGSASEADDAVQEAWVRLDRTDTSAVENLRGWLTTVISRVCLDMLRSRTSRREDPIEPHAEPPAKTTPEDEAVMADSVGVALLVVLNMLEPAERLAFVLHDLFAMPFEEIAGIVGRTPDATRQLASRARRRVRGGAELPTEDLACQRDVVTAFFAALRSGNIDAVVSVLDPDVVVHVEGREIRGARTWAKGAVQFAKALRFAQPALVDGAVGLVLAEGGRLTRALAFTFAGDVISGVEIITEPERVAALDIAVLD